MSYRAFPPILVSCLLISTICRGETPVAGTVETTLWTRSGSPFRVTDHVVVPTGHTLTIEPGVDVLFDADVPFVIEGSLFAVGTEEDSIRFLAGAAANWGGIRITGGDSSAMEFVRMSDGRADGAELAVHGGGLFIRGAGTRVSLTDVVVSGNTAEGDGGGVYVWDAIVSLKTCMVRENEARASGGGIYARGDAAVTLDNAIVLQNRVTGTRSGGGGVYVVGGASLTARGCGFVANEANGDGGGVGLFDKGAALFDRCTISDNLAGGYGGGVSVSLFYTSAHLERCVVTRNRALEGGAFAANGDLASLWADRSTLYGNEAQTGADISVHRASATFTNSILWGNTIASEGGFTADYCLVERPSGTYPGEGNINADPQFVDPEAGDFRLRATSPCIDAGDEASAPDTDGTRADVGAFFYFHRPPIWDALPDVTVPEGGHLAFIVTAEDEDGDVLSYHALRLPEGASFDPSTRRFDWTPDYHQAGPDTAIFAVRDDFSTVYDTVAFVVTDTNRQPVWDDRPDTTVTAGDTLAFTVSAFDPDGDVLHYHALVLPVGAEFLLPSRAFSWSPHAHQVGDTLAVFGVDDGNASVHDTVRITVQKAMGVSFAFPPRRLFLAQNAPNPCNARTTIRFGLTTDGEVRLTIHALNGQAIRTLVAGPMGLGIHAVVWDGTDDDGGQVASGVYLYRLRVEGRARVRTLVVIR